MSEVLLDVKNLITAFDTDTGLMRAVDQVSFSLKKRETLGIVGESGCGKSVTAMSIVKLLPQPSGRILEGRVLFKDRDLVPLESREMREIRGNEIGVIFQEPMTALNPCHRIGKQLSECFLIHKNMNKKEAWEASIEMLKLVRIPAPEHRIGDYPHQLSGGMRQRIVIALALACGPDLIIADEPTANLDTHNANLIIDLMRRINQERGAAFVFSTHDDRLLDRVDRKIHLRDGQIIEDARL